MTEWENCTLGDVLTLQRGFDLPLQDREAGLFPIIASTGPVGVHREAKVTAPGVVIGRSGSIGGGQFITTDFWPLNTTLWVADFKGNHPRFCYYILRSIDFTSFNVGSGVPTLNRNHVHPLPVAIPRPPEQARIAGLLGALDDKIELNRRMNETLEAMAQAIFRDWFVDFGPVRRKLEGATDPVGILGGLTTDPAYAAELAGLFPDRIGEDGLPVGWRGASLGEVTNVVDCLHAKKPIRSNSGGLFLQLSNIVDFGMIDTLDEFLISSEDYEKWTARIEVTRGDCVITNVGRVGAVAQIPSGLRAALGRNMTAIRCRLEFPYPSFLITALLSPAMRQEIEKRTDAGTILSALNVKSIPRLLFTHPGERLVEAFERIAAPLRSSMEAHSAESRTLAETRDYLLPRLMSGEVLVGEPEAVVA